MKSPKSKVRSLKAGFGLVEAVFAAAIAAAFIVVMASVNTAYLSTSYGKGDEIEATFLAGEGVEAVKSIRDNSWSSLYSSVVNGNSYALALTASWAISPGTETIGRYTRVITFAPVYRGASGDIDVSGALDTGGKLVTSQVSWQGKNGTSTKTMQSYIFNIFNN